MRPLSWNKEILYFDGDSYFRDLLESIESARSSILLETYIYEYDPLGMRIEGALIRASRRGVSVRLLVDGIGAARWIERRHPELERSGVALRIFHPVYVSRLLGSLFRRSRQFLSKLNRRNHRKVCVVDEKVAFVGSLNVSADHCASIVGKSAWRDTGVQVSGEPIQDLITAFDHAWMRSHTADGKRQWRETLLDIPKKIKPISPLVRLNFTFKLRRENSRDLRLRFRKAERRIWLTNAYLAPSAPLVRALTKSASRGVDVRLLVPRDSDVFFMPWVAASHYAPLLKAGVRIFEYLPRFLHAKSVIIDDWATVGTSNMNRRSALYDFEVDLELTSTATLSLLESQFHKDLAQAEEVHEVRGGVTAVLGRLFASIFKRWI